jgi:hypothetical protein
MTETKGQLGTRVTACTAIKQAQVGRQRESCGIGHKVIERSRPACCLLYITHTRTRYQLPAATSCSCCQLVAHCPAVRRVRVRRAPLSPLGPLCCCCSLLPAHCQWPVALTAHCSLPTAADDDDCRPATSDQPTSCAIRGARARGGDIGRRSPFAPWVQQGAGLGWVWSGGSNLAPGPLGSVAGDR